MERQLPQIWSPPEVAPYPGPPSFPAMMPTDSRGQIGWTQPYNHPLGTHGVNYWVDPQLLPITASPMSYHQSPGVLQPLQPLWFARPDNRLYVPTAQPVEDRLTSFLKRLETGDEKHELCSYKVKERIHLATSKLEQLQEIMMEIQQLTSAHKGQGHGGVSEDIPAGPSALSPSESLTIGADVQSAVPISKFPVSTGTPGGQSSQQVELETLATSDQDEELSLAQATARALKAFISALLEPVERVRKGEGTEAETAAWRDYEARQRKIKQHRRRRKTSRRQVAQKLREEREAFESVDAAADEWRAQSLAHGIAKERMQQMEKAANAKAREEKRRLEQEVNAFLLLERLQTLRALRVARLRRQGHVFPEEDAHFMARVQRSAQQEAAQGEADSEIFSEGKKSALQPQAPGLAEDSEPGQEKGNNRSGDGSVDGRVESDEQIEGNSMGIGEGGNTGQSEEALRRYYADSATNMGKLIEVRRAWDTFLSPDGSAIPGHWVVPPAPASPLWAHYLDNWRT